MNEVLSGNIPYDLFETDVIEPMLYFAYEGLMHCVAEEVYRLQKLVDDMF